jgi:glycosyltransferase involved in cell wall biosynthesis
MNILFLSELFYPHGGGAEFATHEYSKMLAEQGFNVTVITNRFDEEPEVSKSGKIIIYRFPLLKSSNAVKFQMLFKTDIWLSGSIKEFFEWADVVYIPRFWYSAILVAKAHKKRVIVHLHDYIPVCPLASLYNFNKKSPCKLDICSQKCIFAFEKSFGRSLKSCMASTLLNSTIGRQIHHMLPLSDKIICVSKAQREIIIGKLPKLAEKTEVIYNPLPNCAPSKMGGHAFGFLGGANPIKGFSVLQSALSMVHDGINPVVYATNFSAQRPILTVDKSKIIFSKRLNDLQIDELYGKIRAVIFPSLCPEPSPYVVVEALMRGRIVVASNFGGVTELTEGCEGVFLFEPGNSLALSQLIAEVSRLTQEAASELAKKNRATFLKKFSNERTSKEFISLICG